MYIRAHHEQPGIIAELDSEEDYDRLVRDPEFRKRLEAYGHRRSLSSVIAIAGVLGGIFFLSPNMTGNAIANLTNSTSSFLGAGLLIVGLVAGYFWINKKTY